MSGKAAKTRKVDPGGQAVRFINNLSHTGDYIGQRFRLRDWQETFVRKLFGTLRPDGGRQYRKGFLALPRKQGKTELVAAILLYLMLGTGRKEQRIYSASGDRNQASLIFGAAASMVENDPQLSQVCTVYHGYKKITCDGMGSTYQALSSEAKLKHGLGPSAVLFDEVHVLPNRQLHDILTTGFGARRDPLTLYISTAGFDRASLCYELWQHARHVRDGIVTDPTFLATLFEADPEDDWTSEETWFKAMPALGDFCSLEFIREEFHKAKTQPSFENTFKQLYLNLWTEQATRWLQTERWMACAGLEETELDGRECYAGLDLGVTRDMAALALIFANDLGGFDVAVRYWVPIDGIWKEEPRNFELYRDWHNRGFLEFTPGEATDFDQIENDIVEVNRRWAIRSLFADRAYASHMLSRLFNYHELPVQGIPQGPVTLNEAMVKVETMLLNQTIRHTGNPVLNWNVANANVERNKTGLMYLNKSGTTFRIDGVAALVNAVTAAIADGATDAGPSVYDTRGVFVL